MSSERAFSSAGITVSKCRNRLRGGIVEALQCLNCLICREFLFRGSEIVDLEADDWEVAEEDDAEGSVGMVSWKTMRAIMTLILLWMTNCNLVHWYITSSCDKNRIRGTQVSGPGSGPSQARPSPVCGLGLGLEESQA
jgi:hypothetical protein